MFKTAEQTATEVLYKCAMSEHTRNALVGGATAVNPVIGGIAASMSKPKGDPTSQFWGTLGGGMAGAVAGSGLVVAALLRNPAGRQRLMQMLESQVVPKAWQVPGYAGMGLGGYLAQRKMVGTRRRLEEEDLSAG